MLPVWNGKGAGENIKLRLFPGDIPVWGLRSWEPLNKEWCWFGMNLLHHQPRDGGWTLDALEALVEPSPGPVRPKILKRAETLDEARLYRKRIAPSTGNGSLGRKILQRQSSVNFPSSNGPSSGPSSASSAPRRSSTTLLIASEKLLEAQKRRQESIDRENALPPKQSLSTKFKGFATIFVATLLVLVASSLLFISLLVVDPILVGLKADFRKHPGICRTSQVRNLTGPGNCVMPSCREGCTADLYTCTFLGVTYVETPDLNFTFVQSYYEIQDWDPDGTFSREFLPRLFQRATNSTNVSYNSNNTVQHLTATLMINPNGCGYPPDVNCSTFYDRFGALGTLFPCFYTDSYLNANSPVTVPFYDEGSEIVNLGLYCGIPLGTVLVLSLLLLVLTKLKIRSKRLPSAGILLENVEDQIPARRSCKSRSGNDSARLIDIDEGNDSVVAEGTAAKEAPDRVNGHGPKKKVLLTPTHSSTSLFTTNEKTDDGAAGGGGGGAPRQEVQFPSTSGIFQQQQPNRTNGARITNK